jgi:dehydrogenase/reductase SDR family protein 13
MSIMNDLADRTYLITGATSGLGKVVATELAARGAHVLVACRPGAKADAALDELRRGAGGDRIESIALDLGDLASVRRCAEDVLARNVPIHGLVNNAGLAGAHGTTKDGFELAFGTNHLGHYLLTRLLLDKIVASAPARIVNVASAAHYRVKKIDWDALREPARTRTAFHEYGVSKLANVLFTEELARRLDGKPVTTYAVHPGAVATDVWRQVPAPIAWVIKKLMLSPAQGARGVVRCAADPTLASDSGKYYNREQEKRASRLAGDVPLAAELWRKSAEWTGLSD